MLCIQVRVGNKFINNLYLSAFGPVTKNYSVTRNAENTVTWYFDISSLPKSEKTMRSEFHGFNDVTDDVTNDVTIKLYRRSSRVS